MLIQQNEFLEIFCLDRIKQFLVSFANIYLEPERGIGFGIAINAPSSTKLIFVLQVASNSGEQPQVTSVASDWLFRDRAYSIILAPL